MSFGRRNPAVFGQNQAAGTPPTQLASAPRELPTQLSKYINMRQRDSETKEVPPEIQEEFNKRMTYAKGVGERFATGMFDLIRDERGTHIESVLTLLGAFGGVASQLAALEAHKGDYRAAGLNIAGGADGKQRLVFGDGINFYLLENVLSLWGLTGGMAKHLGSNHLPDMMELVRYTASTFFKPEFGMPRLPAKHMPRALPIYYVNELWPQIGAPAVAGVGGAGFFVSTMGFAVQHTMKEGKAVLDPGMAARVVMESAVPMSKVDASMLGAAAAGHA